MTFSEKAKFLLTSELNNWHTYAVHVGVPVFIGLIRWSWQEAVWSLATSVSVFLLRIHHVSGQSWIGLAELETWSEGNGPDDAIPY